MSMHVVVSRHSTVKLTLIYLSVQLLVCICDLFVAVGRPGSAALPIARGPDSLHHIFCVFKGPQKTFVTAGS